jgi:hypothetical protein
MAVLFLSSSAMSTFLSSGSQGSCRSAQYIQTGRGKVLIHQDHLLLQDFAAEVIQVISIFPIKENINRLVEFPWHSLQRVTAEGLITDSLFCASEKRMRASQSGNEVGHLLVGLGKASIELPS